MHNYQNLVAWQRAYELSLELIAAAGGFKGTVRYSLGDQIARSSISIPSNIAEGSGRQSEKEFRRFLAIALGSAHELETQVMLARDLGLMPDTLSERHLQEVMEVQRMLHGLRSRLQV